MARLTRNELLSALASMGVEIPSHTKLGDDALDKRLRQALGCAESLSRVLPDTPFDPLTLPQWLSRNGSVYEATRRGNMQEAIMNTAAEMRGQQSPFAELYKNVFVDLRQTLLGISQMWDNGVHWCVIQDHVADESAINLRIFGVYEVNSKTPAFVVLYQHATRENPMPALQWLQARASRDQRIQKINATVFEQKLLLKLLAINAKVMSSDLAPSKESDETGFKASFLLPLGPLDYEDLGKLNSDTGCVLCGSKTASRCSQCQSVSYCGQECQRADWPSHKQTCRSLKGGTWRTLRFHNIPPAMEGMFYTSVNRFNLHQAATDRIRKPDNSTPPPNLHGEKVFLVKLQLGVGGPAGSNLMIYDRQRSCEVYFMRETDPRLFLEFKAEVEGPRRKYGGIKMYRWAKRISDWELSVCLDREPLNEIKW
ncbi:hypothetical protein CERSUDRAFT_50971 [Gelatoporia subvermispora B]|uniref:MYND-type domain-containing protein n=1 Tax=Ceriporiopsis subvermispora (strain B) TaxID=914234 RepID=M2RD44_CERS8|nr:hypothetical protein CERSUDRAFT_50971 [Gelatoporia subvermispora B]